MERTFNKPIRDKKIINKRYFFRITTTKKFYKLFGIIKDTPFRINRKTNSKVVYFITEKKVPVTGNVTNRLLLIAKLKEPKNKKDRKFLDYFFNKKTTRYNYLLGEKNGK